MAAEDPDWLYGALHWSPSVGLEEDAQRAALAAAEAYPAQTRTEGNDDALSAASPPADGESADAIELEEGAPTPSAKTRRWKHCDSPRCASIGSASRCSSCCAARIGCSAERVRLILRPEVRTACDDSSWMRRRGARRCLTA